MTFLSRISSLTFSSLSLSLSRPELFLLLCFTHNPSSSFFFFTLSVLSPSCSDEDKWHNLWHTSTRATYSLFLSPIPALHLSLTTQKHTDAPADVQSIGAEAGSHTGTHASSLTFGARNTWLLIALGGNLLLHKKNHNAYSMSKKRVMQGEKRGETERCEMRYMA